MAIACPSASLRRPGVSLLRESKGGRHVSTIVAVAVAVAVVVIAADDVKFDIDLTSF